MEFHTHFSPLHALQAFLAVVIIGTVWRLVGLHLVTSKTKFWHTVGKAALFQY